MRGPLLIQASATYQRTCNEAQTSARLSRDGPAPLQLAITLESTPFFNVAKMERTRAEKNGPIAATGFYFTDKSTTALASPFD